MRYQIHAYEGCYTNVRGRIRPLIGRALFGGRIFPSRTAAVSAWYDTEPGRNDRAIFVPVKSSQNGELPNG